MKRLCLMLLLAASPAQSLELTLPNSTIVRSETDPAGSVRLPEAPWSPGSIPFLAEGAIRREILRTPGALSTTLQLLDGLRGTLEQEGFVEVFTCADAACGSFDFRFQMDILGEPDMHVDLGDYRYLLMRASDPDADPHTVALLASRSQADGFVHITTVSGAEPVSEVEATVPEAPVEPEVPADDLVAALASQGHAVLPGLDFGTGSAELGPGPYPSLETLANWLSENPSAQVVLVGHTDSVGSLEANTALSRQRAASVARFLSQELGANGGQITSSGAGYLSPVASNLTEEGRAANRRVEAVLLSLD